MRVVKHVDRVLVRACQTFRCQHFCRRPCAVNCAVVQQDHSVRICGRNIQSMQHDDDTAARLRVVACQPEDEFLVSDVHRSCWLVEQHKRAGLRHDAGKCCSGTFAT